MGRFRGVPIRVSASWWLVAAFVTLSFAPGYAQRVPDLGLGAYAVAFVFVVLFYLSVLVHEIGHTATALHFGLPVRRITLHLLGGVSEIEQSPATPGRELLISGSGPVVSLLLGVLASQVARVFPDASIARIMLDQLTAANIVVGVFNLLPGLPLDGGHVLRALIWAGTGDPSRATKIAGWMGRLTAVTTLTIPFALASWWGTSPSVVGIVWSALIAAFIWNGSTDALRASVWEQRVDLMSARALARPAHTLPADTSLADAAQHLHQPLLVTGPEGRLLGLVHQPAAAAVPLQRRASMSLSSVSRRLDALPPLAEELTGRSLLDAVAAQPSVAYLLVDRSGKATGLLLLMADLEAALAP